MSPREAAAWEEGPFSLRALSGVRGREEGFP